MKKKILRIPYSLSLHAFKALARLAARAEVWTRHSYNQSYFEPFLSDVDLTIFVFNKKDEARVLKLHRWVQRFCPIFGDVILLNPEKLAFLQKHSLNSFEIDRDPILKSKLQSPMKYSKSEAAVFLQWTLHGDFHNLIRRPQRRLQKWKHHQQHVLQKLQSTLDSRPALELFESDILFSILTWIVSLKGIDNKAQQKLLRSQLQLTLDHVFLHTTHTFILALAEQEPYIWSYFPRWIPQITKTVPNLTASDIEMFLAQLDWDILHLLWLPAEPKSVLKTSENLKFVLNRLQGQISFAVYDSYMSKINSVESILLKPV